MENSTRIKLSEKERKEIYAFRKKRREDQLNPIPEETDPIKKEHKKIVDDFMKAAVPSYYQLQEHIARAADSPWFALSELERFEEHIKSVHSGKVEDCDGGKVSGCLEDYSMEDAKDFVKIIFASIQEHYSKDNNAI